MDENLRLLILTPEGPPKERRLEFRAEKNKVLNTMKSAGAKVRHDSGGRLIVIEVSKEAEKLLSQRLVGARLVPLDADAKEVLGEMDPTESLFLDALKIRTSKDYRDAKKRRKVGDTPEERELVSGPDVREEY